MKIENQNIKKSIKSKAGFLKYNNKIDKLFFNNKKAQISMPWWAEAVQTLK